MEVYAALFLLIVGIIILPFDFVLGSVIGIPGLWILIQMSKMPK